MSRLGRTRGRELVNPLLNIAGGGEVDVREGGLKKIYSVGTFVYAVVALSAGSVFLRNS